ARRRRCARRRRETRFAGWGRQSLGWGKWPGLGRRRLGARLGVELRQGQRRLGPHILFLALLELLQIGNGILGVGAESGQRFAGVGLDAPELVAEGGD